LSLILGASNIQKKNTLNNSRISRRFGGAPNQTHDAKKKGIVAGGREKEIGRSKGKCRWAAEA